MKAKTVAAFIFGAAVGSVATWFGVKKYYEDRANEGVAEVTEHFQNLMKRDHAEPEYDHSDSEIIGDVEDVEVSGNGLKAKVTNLKPAINDYVRKLEEEGYIDYSSMSGSKPEGDKPKWKKPYVIDPENFGELDEYQTVSLTYFEDQVLADDNNDIVEDVEGTVGFDALTSFGRFEDDAVHVRNERLKCDFEILKDLRLYANVVADKNK